MLTDNKLEKMIAKVNLAIAYRMAEQPALSYQILQSIDESILSERRLAGVLVVKGNTAMALHDVEAAIAHYIMARKHYIKAKYRRNATRVTVNLLGAALADQQRTLFEKFRKTLDAKSESHLTDNESAYLLWLDTLYGSVKYKKISPEVERITLNLAPKLLAGGYITPVKMILDRFDATHLISLEAQTKTNKARLKARLVDHWCGSP
uniref:Uncharacterized protein n=1 Tax=Pseudoalteromonas luteoviolacea TaxID=43657 RepID=A0A023Q101_9GAMM|nr:hypothetical protein [Pseudoalteromonas luteoviolacea]